MDDSSPATEIKDIKEILDKLRTSQSWISAQAPPPVPPPTDIPSVASLLSQLNPIQTLVQRPKTPPSPPGVPPEVQKASPPKDVRHLSFQHALPLLAELPPDVLSALSRLKQDQDKMERDLWSERNAIRAKYESKVDIAKHKAVLIGANGVSKHEAEMLSRAYEKELDRFDAERALPAWDALITRQQTTMLELGIPTMFQTTEKQDRERQQKVVQVVESIISGAEL
ncbi:hypothetical protein MKEN_00055200 [Mycena kentingensis (nom. inval.)]|nr:hypothetical protein MKEN_00055200 [Mycena kentingensis (nom. inval.)]